MTDIEKKEDKPKKSGRGGARPGAGRPSKADEIKMIEMMDKTKPKEEVFEALGKLVDEGNERAIRTWLHYRFGRPKDRIELDTKMLAGFKVIRDAGE